MGTRHHGTSRLSKVIILMHKKYDDIILSLKILSQIPNNGRIRRLEKGRYTLEDDRFFTPFRRFVYGDSRKTSINDIEATLSSAFDYIKLLLDSKHATGVTRATREGSRNASPATTDGQDESRTIYSQIGNIYKELGRSMAGLKNLKESTYAGDADMVAKIEWAIERIDEQREEIVAKFPALAVDENSANVWETGSNV